MTKSTLAVPTTTSAVFVVLAVVAVTVHVPTSSTINVQFPLASAVPETVLLPFVAVTVAPALVVTTICKSGAPSMACTALTNPSGNASCADVPPFVRMASATAVRSAFSCAESTALSNAISSFLLSILAARQARPAPARPYPLP